MENFVHLHCHSEFSLLDGLSRVEDLVDKALEYEQKALAITDHARMGNVPKFYKTAKAKGIEPIIGQEFYVCDDVNVKVRGENRSHLVLLALNKTGYETLCKLSTLASENFYYYPRLDHNLLRSYAKEFTNIVATSSCMSGEIPSAILEGDDNKVVSLFEFYNSVFPNFFIEIMKHGDAHSHSPNEVEFNKNEDVINQALYKYQAKYNTPLIVTNDSHYIEQEDGHAHDIWLCMQTNAKITDEKRFKFNGDGYHFASTEEMKEKFPPDVWAKSEESMGWILDNINIKLDEFENNKHFIPSFGKGDANKELKRLCLRGLHQKVSFDKRKEYRKELLRQLAIIKDCGFADMFLIVKDYVDYARSNNIAVGEGRGSMVGVLVSYLLGITSVDPIRFNLSFERALNPARPSLPDFDVDFADRDAIISYLQDKYGEQNTMQIGTYSELKPRSLLRGILRVLDYPYQESINYTKHLPETADVIGDKAMGEVSMIIEDASPELKQLFNNDDRIIPLMYKFNGLVQSMGTHAGGLLIGDGTKPIRSLIPTSRLSSEQNLIAQFDKKAIEDDLGFVKFDILGLTTLKIIQKCLELIGKDVFHNFPDNSKLNDKKTLDLINSGNLTYIFQLDGMANRSAINSIGGLKSFEDIVTCTSISRPGTAKFIPDLIENRRKGRVNYPHPDLEDILKTSDGVLLYQEQVMQIAQKLAGFDMVQIDDIKNLIRTKDKQKFDAMKPKFISGCNENGYTDKVANEIWNLIENASGYLFNRSHAVSYSITTYQTAYLKAHYPLEFFTACLNVEDKNDEKLRSLINESFRMQVKIKRPSIRKSMQYSVIEDDSIRLGLCAVKYVGFNTANAIVLERNRNGLKGIRELPKRIMTSRVVSVLQDVGAFGKKYINTQKQNELLGFMLDSPIKNEDLISFCKKAFGASAGTLEDVEEKIIKNRCLKIGDEMAFGGFVDRFYKTKTKTGKNMAYVDIVDCGMKQTLVLFHNNLNAWEKHLQMGNIVLIYGNKQEKYNTIVPSGVQIVERKI